MASQGQETKRSPVTCPAASPDQSSTENRRLHISSGVATSAARQQVAHSAAIICRWRACEAPSPIPRVVISLRSHHSRRNHTSGRIFVLRRAVPRPWQSVGQTGLSAQGPALFCGRSSAIRRGCMPHGHRAVWLPLGKLSMARQIGSLHWLCRLEPLGCPELEATFAFHRWSLVSINTLMSSASRFSPFECWHLCLAQPSNMVDLGA